MTSPRWTEVSEPRAYLYRAVLNEVRQSSRAAKRRLRREFAVARHDAVEPDVTRIELADALAALSLEQRAVLVLAYWFEMSSVQIAATLERSQRSTERLLSSAKQCLRRSLQ